MTAQLAQLRASTSQEHAKTLVQDTRTRALRNAISFYAFLWLTEGALRRWILPQASDILLIVRDPVVLYIYWLAARTGVFRLNGIETSALAIVSVAFFMTFIVGHGDLAVAVYGVRTLILHLPLMFIMGRVLDIRYVNALSKVVMYLTLPMTILIVDQFYSPQSALVNIGVGGVGSAGFSGALDRFRPPGTFSFISGPVSFYTLATACFYFEFLKGRLPGWVLFAAGICILIACPVSISRTFIVSVLIVSALGLTVLASFGRLSMGVLLRTALFAMAAVAVLTQLGIVSDALEAFGARWYMSTTQEGGISTAIFDRFFSTLTGPILDALDQPFFGFGLGMGTNVGAKLLVGEARFLGGEGEWFRLISELGPALGIAFIILRTYLVWNVFVFARNRWRRGNPIPMLFLSVAALPLLQGQWGQPTSLGFAIFSGGLVLACGNVPTTDTVASTDFDELARLPA